MGLGIDGATLLVIATSLGIGEAIRLAGTDRVLAEVLASARASHPSAALVAMDPATTILTERIHHRAAAALVSPFGLSLALALPLPRRTPPGRDKATGSRPRRGG